MSRPVALVTGSTQGIGDAIALRLAREGYDVALNGLGDPERIESRRAAIEAETGARVVFCPADLSDGAAAADLVAAAEAAVGPIEVLVNNAGVLNTPPKPVDEVDPARWELSFAVNVTAAFHTIRRALPGMRQRGRGRIVNVASACGLIALPNSAPYVASKHAIVGLTRAVALDLAETPITCNAICPGLVETEFMTDRLNQAAARRGVGMEEITKLALRGRQPSGRLIKPEEIAGLVAFLAGPDGGSFNGAAIAVDQAWTAM